jgi:hypothetical protein
LHSAEPDRQIDGVQDFLPEVSANARAGQITPLHRARSIRRVLSKGVLSMKRSCLLKASVLFLFALSIAAPGPVSAIAANDGWMDVKHSVDGLSAFSTDGSLRASAEYSLRQGQIDKSINFCRQAIERGESDMDLHAIYAEALEQKIKVLSGSGRSATAKECIRQWLLVLRNETGEEKGTSFHGIGIPLVGHLYEDDERHISAKVHLKRVAGRTPHVWETDSKYLQAVLRDERSVTARLLKLD